MPVELRDYTERLTALRAADEATTYYRAMALGHRIDELPDTYRRLKSAVAAGDLGVVSQLHATFAGTVRPKTILGTLVGTVPASMNGVVATVNADMIRAAAVVDGAAVPVSRATISSVTVPPQTLRTILTFEKRALESVDARSKVQLERALVAAFVAMEDTMFLDDVLSGVASVGTITADTLSTMVATLIAAVSAGNPMNLAIIASPAGFSYLTLQGGVQFASTSTPGVQYIVSSAAGNRLVAIDAALLAVADDGLRVDRSESASLIMSDTPASESGPVITMFQVNTIALRLSRFLSWLKLAPDAAASATLPAPLAQ